MLAGLRLGYVAGHFLIVRVAGDWHLLDSVLIAKTNVDPTHPLQPTPGQVLSPIPSIPQQQPRARTSQLEVLEQTGENNLSVDLELVLQAKKPLEKSHDDIAMHAARESGLETDEDK